MHKLIKCGLLLSTSLITNSCSKSTILAIAVSNIPSGSKTIIINTTINQVTYKVAPFEIKDSKSKIYSIEIPSTITTGLIDLEVLAKDTAYTADGTPLETPIKKSCDTARWYGSIPVIDPENYSISATLEKVVDDPIDQDLFTVKALKRDDAWAAGANGKITHWDGCFWKSYDFAANTDYSTQLDKPGDYTFIKLFYNEKIGLWATGSDGLIYKYNPSSDRWKAHGGAREKFPVAFGTGVPAIPPAEWYQGMFWLDIAYLNGTSGDFIIVGSNNHPYATHPSSKSNCMAVRGTPSTTAAGEYSFTVVSSVCDSQIAASKSNNPPPTPVAPAPVPDWSSCTNCFTPRGVISFSDSVIVTGLVKVPDLAKSTILTYGAYITYNSPNDLSIGKAVGKFVVPHWTNANQERYGGSFAIWGTSSSDYWIGNNRLFHVAPAEPNPQGSPELVTKLYEDKGIGSSYTINRIWGLSKNDFWVLVLYNNVSQVHHFTSQSNLTAKDIDQLRYKAPIEGFTYTSVDGTATDDTWLVGYRGVRVHYDGAKTIVHK